MCRRPACLGAGGAYSLEALPAGAAAAVRPTVQEAARNRGALCALGHPWRGLRGEEQGWVGPHLGHTPSLGEAPSVVVVGCCRLPAPRGPPRAPPTAHLPRPASRARRPQRSVPPHRDRFWAPAHGSWRLGAMGECGPADVCSRPAGLLAARVALRASRRVGAGPAPGRALLEPGGRRPLHLGLAAAALSSPLPPRCGAQASGKKRHQLRGGQTHGQSRAAGNGVRPRPLEGSVWLQRV